MTPHAMQYSYQPKDTGRKYRGLTIVAALHLLLAWAIVSGTAKKGFEIIKKPLEAVVIQEVIIVPPPVKEIKPPEVKAPKTQAAPPPFVPKSEVTPTQSPTPALVIASVEAPPATPAVIAPPTPPTPPQTVKTDIGVACPTQVPPDMPKRAVQDGVAGVVRAQALIKDGVVREVTVLSGPRVFHAAVRAAMLQYKCTQSAGDVIATQEFNFKIE